MSDSNGKLLRKAEHELSFAWQRWQIVENTEAAEAFDIEYRRSAAHELVTHANRYYMLKVQPDLVFVGEPIPTAEKYAALLRGELCEVGTGWEIDATTLDAVEARPVKWIWKPRIPRGMVTILCGAKASGKGQTAVNIMAAVSTGGILPAWEENAYVPIDKGRVIYLNVEDPVAQTIVPRLEEAGADKSRVTHMAHRKRKNSSGHVEARVLTLADDFDALWAKCEEVRPDLFVIDTLFSHAGADTNSNYEMAPIMARLCILAENFNMGVLVIHHPTKGLAARASGDVSGATCISTAARSVLMAGTDADKGRRALFHLDSNVDREAPPLAYRVGPFKWIGQTDLTLDEIRRHGPRTAPGPSKAEKAVAFLRDALKDGPRLTSCVEAEALAAGITIGTLTRARKGLVKADRPKDAGGEWWLRLIQGDQDEQGGTHNA